MIYLAWILSLIATALLGYHYKGVTKRVIEVEKAVAQKIDKPEAIEESPSEIIDPYDAVAEAQYAMEQERKRLDAIQ
jgi:hypothetical protein